MNIKPAICGLVYLPVKNSVGRTMAEIWPKEKKMAVYANINEDELYSQLTKLWLSHRDHLSELSAPMIKKSNGEYIYDRREWKVTNSDKNYTRKGLT